MNTPNQIVKALQSIFTAAKFGTDVIVQATRGVVTRIITPRPLLEGELDAAIAALPPEDKYAALRNKCAKYSQNRLDAFAASLGYDNIMSLRSASLSSIPRFRSEGFAGQDAWDAEWSAAQVFIAAAQAGQVEATYENYKAALPANFTAPRY